MKNNELQKAFVEYCGGIYDSEVNIQGGFSEKSMNDLGFDSIGVAFRNNSKTKRQYMIIHQITSTSRRQGALSKIISKIKEFAIMNNLYIELEDSSLGISGFDVWGHYGFDGNYHDDRRYFNL